MQKITIDIDEKGNATIEGHAIEGPVCEQLTQGIQEALGEVTSSIKKTEYYRATRTVTRTNSH